MIVSLTSFSDGDEARNSSFSSPSLSLISSTHKKRGPFSVCGRERSVFALSSSWPILLLFLPFPFPNDHQNGLNQILLFVDVGDVIIALSMEPPSLSSLFLFSFFAAISFWRREKDLARRTIAVLTFSGSAFPFPPLPSFLRPRARDPLYGRNALREERRDRPPVKHSVTFFPPPRARQRCGCGSRKIPPSTRWIKEEGKMPAYGPFFFSSSLLLGQVQRAIAPNIALVSGQNFKRQGATTISLSSFSSLLPPFPPFLPLLPVPRGGWISLSPLGEIQPGRVSKLFLGLALVCTGVILPFSFPPCPFVHR